MLSLESINSCMSCNGKNELFFCKYCLFDEIIESVNIVIKENVDGLICNMFIDEFFVVFISLDGKFLKGIKL